MSNTSQSSPSEWLVGAFKKHPEGFLLLAAGAVLLMHQGAGANAQSAVASAQSTVSGASSRVAEATAGARDYAADAADRTLRSASSLASTAADYATQATHKVGEQSERVIQQAQSSLQAGINRVLKDQPLVIAITGMAAGAAIASVFSTTDFGRETLGPIGDQVSEAASRVGEQLQEATATAGETLMRAADQRGLNVDGLKEVASEVAGAFTNSMGAKGDPQNKPRANEAY